MKKLGIALLVGVSAISLLTGCDTKDKDKDKDSGKDKVVSNTNTEVIKDQNLGVFEFQNTSLIYENGQSILEVEVTNTSAVDQQIVEFSIIVKDENDEEIITLVGFVGDVIKAGESKVITSSCGKDLSKAASISYELVK